jgi:hypothetical protein
MAPRLLLPFALAAFGLFACHKAEVTSYRIPKETAPAHPAMAAPAPAAVAPTDATHAAVDRATHPFVIYFSGWAKPTEPASQSLRGCHPFLERLLDLGLLARREGIEAKDYGLSALLGRSEGDEDLHGLWEAGLRAAYPSATAKDAELSARVANAIADARGFYAFTDPAVTAPGGPREEWLRGLDSEDARRLISIIYPLQAPSGLDAMNEAGAEWEDPSGDGRRSRESYLDLIDRGTAEASKAIASVLEFWRGGLGEAELASELGEGGLALLDSSGASLTPRISAPLPLREAMDAEYELRAGARSR